MNLTAKLTKTYLLKKKSNDRIAAFEKGEGRAAEEGRESGWEGGGGGGGRKGGVGKIFYYNHQTRTLDRYVHSSNLVSSQD